MLGMFFHGLDAQLFGNELHGGTSAGLSAMTIGSARAHAMG